MKILTLNKPNITDFAFERNALLKKAKTDWVLFIDNDERINSEEFTTKSVILINNYYDSYKIIRKNYFLGQYVGTDKIIRLVKKGTGKWIRAVHEIWKSNNLSKVGVIKNNYIIHNTAVNLSDYIKKINNYSTLHAKANLKEGKKANLFKIIIYPIGNLVVHLVKSRNIVYSIMKSLHSFLSWAKMYFHPEQK